MTSFLSSGSTFVRHILAALVALILVAGFIVSFPQMASAQSLNHASAHTSHTASSCYYVRQGIAYDPNHQVEIVAWEWTCGDLIHAQAFNVSGQYCSCTITAEIQNKAGVTVSGSAYNLPPGGNVNTNVISGPLNWAAGFFGSSSGWIYG